MPTKCCCFRLPFQVLWHRERGLIWANASRVTKTDKISRSLDCSFDQLFVSMPPHLTLLKSGPSKVSLLSEDRFGASVYFRHHFHTFDRLDKNQWSANPNCSSTWFIVFSSLLHLEMFLQSSKSIPSVMKQQLASYQSNLLHFLPVDIGIDLIDLTST